MTDHNVSAFGIAVARENGSDDLCVLPGMELTVAFSDSPLIRDLRIHVLAIFPENTHQEAIARILPPNTNSEAERDTQAAFTYSSVKELIRSIHNEKGIAIAAHVESKDYGIRGVYRNTVELLLHPIGGSREAGKVLKTLCDQVKDELVEFNAIQVTPVTNSVHYCGSSGELRVPLIVASDCHNVRELGQDQSDHYSFVKMASPSFEGLRDALKYPDLRVRFKAGLPETKPPRLLGLRISGDRENEKAFFNDTVLGFSDNLTCLIGPRGSGKSAVIDGLRYLMGYNRTLNRISKVKDQVVDRQRHTLERSRIEALYETADEGVYRLVATYDSDEEYVTQVFDMEGNPVRIDDVEACGKFPLSLFGWGELELLADKPASQREQLDRFVPDVGDLKKLKSDILSDLKSNRDACVETARHMRQYFEEPDLDFQRINEHKRKFDDLNTEEMQGLFAQIDEVRTKRNALANIETELQKRLQRGDIAPALEISMYLKDERLRKWAESLSERLQPESLDDWMRETSREHKRKIEAALEIVTAERKDIEREEVAAQKEIQTAIGEDAAITGDLRNSAKARFEQASANFDKYQKLWGELKRLLQERSALLDRFDDNDRHIFATRERETTRIQQKVSLVEDETYRIGLVIKQQSDRSVFLSHLEDGGIAFSGHWKAHRRPEIIAYNLTPRSLAKAIYMGRVDELAGLSVDIEGAKYSLRHSDAEQIVRDNQPIERLEDLETVKVDSGKLDRVLHIEELSVDDEFYITLGGKPIHFCSPGQRCSAMLPIVALTSPAPLVIDQPEDNLDNRLVSRALFKILARLKETRQIVFATHNPNILVSGDAEQVLLLNPEGQLEQHGCIDSPQIIQSVIGLMEGGAEAFRRRQTKYESHL